MPFAVWHPLQAIPVGRRRYAFPALLVLTLVLTAVLGRVDQPIRTAAAPNGIISYEVAGDTTTAARMIESWDARARCYAAFSLGIDYLYMVAYSTTIALACLWAADVFRAGTSLGAFGPWLAWGQWLAALCDATENMALTLMLLGSVTAPWPRVAWWSAVPKFVLVEAGLLYALVALGVRLVRGAERR